jgi:hypothetical protein
MACEGNTQDCVSGISEKGCEDMSQNTSHAVMQQRHEAHDSLDDFPTPPWATRALVVHVLFGMQPGLERRISEQTVWEPACNRGYMAKPLAEYFKKVGTSDIHDYGWEGQQEVEDFLFMAPGSLAMVDWIITNPPFRLAAQFAMTCIQLKPMVGFALLVRTSFLEGQERYSKLFSKAPPAIVAQFTERVPMVKGRHDPEASTATSYAWLVWKTGHTGPTAFQWIPPCRKQLQRASDAEFTPSNSKGDGTP